MSNEQPCEGCPFKDLSEQEKQGAVEPGIEPCQMLCHESECLDGDRPDRLCVGFHREDQ